MKFLITPNYRTPYDQRMVNGLANGFRIIGHQANALPGPISSDELAKKCKELSIDVVIQVNRTRSPDAPLPSKVRYISWFQDVFPETTNGFADGFHKSDILFALGDSEVLGLNVQLPCYVGTLVSGVDEPLFDYRPRSTANPVDFSLCGFIPPPLHSGRSNLLRMMPQALKVALWTLIRRYLRSDHMPYATRLAIMDTVRNLYRPLRGELDIHELALAMRNKIAALDGLKQVELRKSAEQSLVSGGRTNRYPHDIHPSFEKQISRFARDYPRLLDRAALIKEVLQISDSLELYGPGWHSHYDFRPYAKGVINTQNELLDVYCRSRINLANNTHGLGLHSRTLECMAVGGFIFTHESPHDNKPGGMLTSFEPGVHYGAFTPENLHEEAHRWLADDTKRRQAGQQAAAVVRQRHCWHHRAQQIIDDLEK